MLLQIRPSFFSWNTILCCLSLLKSNLLAVQNNKKTESNILFYLNGRKRLVSVLFLASFFPSLVQFFTEPTVNRTSSWDNIPLFISSPYLIQLKDSKYSSLVWSETLFFLLFLHLHISFEKRKESRISILVAFCFFSSNQFFYAIKGKKLKHTVLSLWLLWFLSWNVI